MRFVYFCVILSCLFIPLWLRAGSVWLIDKDTFNQSVIRHSAQGANQTAQQWLTLIDELNSAPVTDAKNTHVHAIKKMNTFIHSKVSYQTDQQLYGTEDYWASVAETFGQGYGDCEDFAIAQYTTLRSIGIDDAKLRLIYVRARIGGPQSSVTQAHMVLGYYHTPNAEPLIIDSLIEEVLPASERSDLTPVFSFNASGLWAGSSSKKAKSNPLDRLSRWRDVLSRIEQEGISWRNN